MCFTTVYESFLAMDKTFDPTQGIPLDVLTDSEGTDIMYLGPKGNTEVWTDPMKSMVLIEYILIHCGGDKPFKVIEEDLFAHQYAIRSFLTGGFALDGTVFKVLDGALYHGKKFCDLPWAIRTKILRFQFKFGISMWIGSLDDQVKYLPEPSWLHREFVRLCFLAKRRVRRSWKHWRAFPY